MRITFTFVTLATALFTTQWAAVASQQPNVILIMTDDQGYGDVSITGNEIVETPHMDSLAKEGAWLKQFYVSPVCTPTRAHLMTGRYAFRTRAIDTYLGRAVMEPSETTLAEVLQKAGYATGIFGKWHLGDYFPTRAMDQGFAEALVHQGGGLRQPANPPEGERYHDPILFHNGEPKQYEGYCTDIYFDEAARYIEKQAADKKPFFVYLPTNAPHGPFDEPPTRELLEHFQAKLAKDKNSNRAGFYSMIKNVDDNIGRLLAKLKDLKIDEETIVIFLTDNGPAGGGSSGPFRGRKATVYEGGIRTVCFVRWPGKIEPDSSVQFTTAHIDLMPTILDFCEVAAPEELALDGSSLRPLISEKGVSKIQGWQDRHLFLQWHRGNTPQKYHHFAAISPSGQWKLLQSSNAGSHDFSGDPKFELYDLHNDPAEATNVIAENSDIADQLKTAYDAWFEDVTNTRDPNFGMPDIVIGAPEQTTTVLTPQDKRTSSADKKGWWTPGHWPVDVRSEGPYTIQIRLQTAAKEKTTVTLSLETEGSKWDMEMLVPRGAHSNAIGEIKLPVGTGQLTATTDHEEEGIHVLHVTFQ